MVSDAAKNLAKEILEKREKGSPTLTNLETNERVIARVTEGIYRQPAASLRELISNAYDADATSVIIQTDAPRFEKIIVRDDGIGMTEEALASLIKDIGGSTKRTADGYEIGISRKNNSLLSPGGRKLIGKIGIGLFSVAQLSRHFQIITKVKGSKFRTVAEVMLKTYSEDTPSKKGKNGKQLFDSGQVRIESVPAKDVDSHGTEIVIMELHEGAKNVLRSMDIWKVQNSSEYESFDDIHTPTNPPTHHIGSIDEKEDSNIKTPANLPWDEKDDSETRFKKLEGCVINQFETGDENPKLERIFDNYLRMIWTLSISVPLNYIDIHPFDLTDTKKYGNLNIYELGNSKENQAKELILSKGKRIRDVLSLTSPERGGANSFEVILDGIKLIRPIRLWNNLCTNNAIKYPILFIGSFTPDLSKIPREIRGGVLSFEAYFLWTPKVVPVEHQGVMLRISDVSGTLFDPSFMKYPISEQTRLRQITAEVFVKEGLDPALNIDRESFNQSHPHYQIIVTWVHNALRQIANRHKKIGADIRKIKDEKKAEEKADEFDKFVEKEVNDVKKQEVQREIILTDKTKTQQSKRSEGALVFDKKKILSSISPAKRYTRKNKIADKYFERKVNALIKLLDAYDVFENMPHEKQEELIRKIVGIFGYSMGD
ncbi:MAG: ATP-binding protein [archaeon]|nr:ATP-binding protein [archaeon]